MFFLPSVHGWATWLHQSPYWPSGFNLVFLNPELKKSPDPQALLQGNSCQNLWRRGVGSSIKDICSHACTYRHMHRWLTGLFKAQAGLRPMRSDQLKRCMAPFSLIAPQVWASQSCVLARRVLVFWQVKVGRW